MLYNEKIKAHLEKAEHNARKAHEYRQRGKHEKSEHYKRISEAHIRNAMFYRRHAQIVSLAMAF